MLRLTLIARVSDGLPLSSSVEDDEREIYTYREQAKRVLKSLNASSPRRCTVISDDFLFHFVLLNDVAYLVLCERSYPAALAFHYLDTLAADFDRLNAAEVATASRDYAFVRFEPVIRRTKRLYADSRSARNAEIADSGAAAVGVTRMSLDDAVRGSRRNLTSAYQRGGGGAPAYGSNASDGYDPKAKAKAKVRMSQFNQLMAVGPPAVIVTALIILLICYALFFA